MASRSLEDLHPAMQPLARELIARAASAAIPLKITCTLQSMEEQAKLYAQGRGLPGNIVTYARPGYSFHNFGLALDVVPTALINLPLWGETAGYRDDAHAMWDQLGSIGVDLGLTWGGEFARFKDRPHFEWSDGLTLAELRGGRRPMLASV
jgi:peptidoglycan LD-endopeptidase CwlK